MCEGGLVLFLVGLILGMLMMAMILRGGGGRHYCD